MGEGKSRKPSFTSKSAEESAEQIGKAVQDSAEMSEAEENEYDAQWGYFDDD